MFTLQGKRGGGMLIRSRTWLFVLRNLQFVRHL